MTSPSFNKRFREAIQQERQNERLTKRLLTLQKQYKQIESRCKQLEIQYQKEAMDVEKLDQITVKGLIRSIRQSQEELREKELKERLDAKLRLEACRDDLVDVELEMDDIQYQLEEMSTNAINMQKLLREKEELLLQAMNSNTARLLQITDKQGQIEANIVEIDEAIQAGILLLRKLSVAHNKLGQTTGYHSRNRGIFETLALHGMLSEFRGLLHDGQRALAKFQRELRDVDESSQINFRITQDMQFWDLWKEGFFIDFFLQQKLDQAQRNVNRVHKRAKRAVEGLYDVKSSAEKDIEKLTDDYRDFVIKTDI